MEWFVKRGDDGERGPYTPDELSSSLRDGYVTDATLIRPGDAPGGWRTLSESRAALGLAPVAPAALAWKGRIDDPDHDPPQELANPYKGDVLIGSIAAVIGLLITMVSYDAARGGGRYLIAMGPVAWGVARIARGLGAQRRG